MKSKAKYKVGKQIGDLTITDRTSTGLYEMTCVCGNTTCGKSEFVQSKISNFTKEGFTGCIDCVWNKRKKVKSNTELYGIVYSNYKRSAKKRNLDFTLSKEEACKLFGKSCYYCGQAPNNKRVRHDNIVVVYNGIDRLDSSKGYTVDNTAPCCKYCNFAKNDMSKKEFLQHIKRIYLFNVQRPSSGEEYIQVGGNRRLL